MRPFTSWAVLAGGAVVAVVAAVLLFGPAPASAQSPLNPMAPYNPMMPGGQGPPGADKEAVPLNPEFGDLPDTEGAETTFYMCTACHSTAIIRQQHVTDARWDSLWQWMIEEQGMNDPGPEVREEILTYLKRHFSSER